MSEDHVLIEHRLGTLETGLQQSDRDIERLDGESGEQSDRILALEHWYRGNGARGAEARLQGVEADVVVLKECLGASRADEAIERIASVAARSIVKGARDRDKTTVEKMKAVGTLLGPILSAVALIAAAIIAAVAAT